MKRILAFLCVLALVLSVVPAAAFAADNQDLQAEINANAEEIIVLEAAASNVTVNRDITIDLNGHDLDGVTVTGGTLYLLDSQTADYTVADGVYGKVTNVTGTVKAAEGYLQVGDSFHAVNLDIYAMTLRASDVGVYYKSHFAADEVVAAQVESFGVALSVVTAPNAQNLDSYCGYSQFTGFEAGEGANTAGTSTLLKGIMKQTNGDNKNAKNAAMPVYGRAYIKTGDGYFFGETVKRSLQEQIELIDTKWNGLTDNQKAPVQALVESYNSVMSGWNIPNILGGEAGEGAGEIEIDVPVAAENGVVTEAVTVEQGAVSITVPAGVKLSEGANKLTLTVTPKETSDAGLTLEASEVLMPMDVHVAGVAADNAVPMTIYLGKVMAENLNMGNYTVYHVENGKANEMVLVPVSEEFTAHNQYKYTLDGELTLYVANFSEFAVRSNTNNAWNGTRTYDWYTENPNGDTFYIRNADQLAGFGAIVGGMDGQERDSFAGKTVMLVADISINDLTSENDVVFYPIGYYNDYGGFVRVPNVTVNCWFKPFEGTFDGNGNTISDFYQNTWEMFGDYNEGYSGTPNYYREGMGLFGKVYGGTVKNLIVQNFSCDSEHGTSGTIAAYADCGATFENIAIFGCNPRVYNIGNGGIVGCAGWYAKETAENKVTFRNITVDNSNTIAALWDATGTSAGGILGQYYPTSGQSSANYPKNPGIHFENCRVSAVIEVNNDCCSNYHYYWYRYAGMLMGSVRANTVDEKTGYTMADTTGITAENCEVNYGYWNEYWYCELVKNTIASYTHDHQFGRLTSITDLSQITGDGGETWLKEGNFALLDENRNCVDCYHIFKNSMGQLYRHYHDQPDETNPEIYEDFDLNGDGLLNDLKEDRHRYYIPFGQLLTGDGMGILAHYEFEGVTVKEKDQGGTLLSQEKFVVKDTFTAAPGEWKLSEIFRLKDGVSLNPGSVQAYISPVGSDSTVKPAACVISNGDWENGILTIQGNGAAKITITDYWYCTPTTVNVTLNSYTAPLKFKEGTKEAYCPACDAVVTWTAADPATVYGLTNGSHLYLDTDVTYDGEANWLTTPGGNNSACFHLNGHGVKITVDKAFVGNFGGYINVMGTGTVTKTTGTENGVFQTNTSAKTCGVEIYGGNYVAESGYVFYVRGNGGEFGAHKGVTLTADGGTAIYVGGSGLRQSRVTLEGVIVEGAITIATPATEATASSAQDSWGNTYVTLADTTVNGTVAAYNNGLAEGKVFAFTVSGSTRISCVKLNNKAKLTLGEMTDGAMIGVSATVDSPFTVENTNAAAYRKYFYASVGGQIVKVEGEQLVCKTQTYADALEFRADGTAWCMACKANVEWEDVSNVPATFTRTGEHYHYYVPENMTLADTENMHFYIRSIGSGANKVCLHLNNKKLTLTNEFYNGCNATLNIMGGGEIVGAAKKDIFHIYTATTNLYGGTYTAGKNGGLVNMDRAQSVLNLYSDANLLGEFNMDIGTLKLYDEAIIGSLNITRTLMANGTGYETNNTTFCAGWTGSVKLMVEDALLTNGVVDSSYVKVESTAAGTITSTMGDVTVDAQTGAITITTGAAEE